MSLPHEATPTQEASGLATQSALTQITTSTRSSSFDAHNAPEPAVMDKCVHCGFCLPACPTYVLWGEEMDSPRGRIYMMRKAALGRSSTRQHLPTHMDNCLGCMACMTACPSGVQYNKLIEDTRAQVERQHPAVTFALRLASSASSSSPPSLTQNACASSASRSRSINAPACNRSSAPPACSNSFPRACNRWNPCSPPSRSTPSTRSRAPSPQATARAAASACSPAACSTSSSRTSTPPPRAFSPPKAAKSSSRNQQSCCGALMVHSGLEEQAAAIREEIIATFEAANVDTIVINAAGCGSTMKEYGHLLRDDPAWAARAAAFSAKCKDISEVLCSCRAHRAAPPIALRVAYHDACHLRHAQGIHQQPRDLLAQIPSLEVAEIAEASLCCGSAGVYNLLQPEPANELGDRKVAHLLATGAEAVISANPGCLLQLMSGLRRRGAADCPPSTWSNSSTPPSAASPSTSSSTARARSTSTDCLAKVCPISLRAFARRVG